MSEKKKCESKSPPSAEPLLTDELPEQTGKEVSVHYQPTPTRSRLAYDIHPRMPIPLVPEGEEVQDDHPSPPVELD